MDTASLLADLNAPQREAVQHEDGPLLIVAGAGSGKTRVITRRIAHLISRGVSPHAILAITFTNKAAGEMRERVERQVGAGRVWMGTFHGMGARILRLDGEVVGVDRGFTIYDRTDQVAVVKDICKDLGIDTQNLRPRAVHAALSRLKNDGLSAEEALDGAVTPFDRVVGQVFGRYQEALAASRALDFDDLLLRTAELLQGHPEVLARYQQRFEHVLVDEYQDTSAIQYRITKAVAEGHGNLCATGDPDQSIYRWRGADIRNILDFERDFPGARVVRLEQNYRSVGNVLSAASAVIAQNPDRMMGALWSELDQGPPVMVMATDDEEREAEAVVRQAGALRAEGVPLTEMAVFYRTNALSRGLERALRLANLPYEIVGAVEFYERKEVKDVLAYLRLLVNPADAVAFLRVVNTPSRGIGRTTLERLRAWAAPLGLTPREAARRADEAPGVTARARKALATLTALLDELERTLDGPPEDSLQAVLDRTGYLDYLEDFGGHEARERGENVRELQAALAAHVRNEPEPSVGAFLEETALVSDVDGFDPGAERLTLMTLHAAKGLEFTAVFIVGLEEGLLPHQRSLDKDEELQEERRLCYVGLTRARRHLCLSWAARRAAWGAWMGTSPSRFLAELPPEAVQQDDRRRGLRAGPARLRPAGAARVAERPEYTPDPDDYLDVPAQTRLPTRGQAVRHPHFGSGVVLAVSGVDARARITVRFERFGDKQLLAEYARLDFEQES